MAVHKLAQQGRKEDLVLFTRAARDISPLVREESIPGLGRSQDPRVVDLLAELLEDPVEGVQMRAAVALADVNNDRSRSALIAQYAGRGRSTRAAIIQALKVAKVSTPMARVVAAEANVLWTRYSRALAFGSLAERVGAAEEVGKSGRAEAVTLLLPLAKDGHVVLAAAAVRGLAEAGDVRVAPALAGLLTQGSPELRDAAIGALGRLKNVATLSALERLAQEGSAASTLATQAIFGFPRSPATDEVLCALSLSAPEAQALEAALEMGRRGGCPLEAIERKLNRASKLLRRRQRLAPESLAAGLVAVRGLGPTAKGALSWVLPLLREKDTRIRTLAVQAVGALREPSATAAVEKFFQQEADALKPARAKWVSSPLPTAFQSGFDPAQPDGDAADQTRARQEALFRNARELQDARSHEAGKLSLSRRAPTELVDDVPEDSLQALAASALALAELQAPSALAHLTLLTGDGSPTLRAAAYAGLAALGAPGQLLARAGLLDPDRDVQWATAAALVAAGPSGAEVVLEVSSQLSGDRLGLLNGLRGCALPSSAVPLLEELLRGGGPEGTLAAEFLGVLEAPSAVQPLLQALQEPNRLSRRAVLEALGKIGDKRALDALTAELYSESSSVRAAAAAALFRIGTGAQSEALVALKEDYYREVRRSAGGGTP